MNGELQLRWQSGPAVSVCNFTVQLAKSQICRRYAQSTHIHSSPKRQQLQSADLLF